MYALSPKELAPTEDQGAVFGALDVPANATLEQITAYSTEVGEAFQSVPEFHHSFQITFATGGFGGMIVVPWEERKRDIFEIQAEVSRKTATVTGIRAPVFLRSALPSAGFFPVEVVIASTASHEEIVRFAGELSQEAAKSGLVLAAQFNSFRDPLVILGGSVPLAMFGALVFTFLKFSGPPGMKFGLTEGWTTTLNIYSQVGLVTLVGLVSKNGILIVAFANAAQERGLSKLAAVQEASATRLRPILMTTFATVAGHFLLTLVTGAGAGAVARNSIGIVLVGGMAIGTLFTLFVVPSLYVLIAKDHRGEEVHAANAAPAPAPAE